MEALHKTLLDEITRVTEISTIYKGLENNTGMMAAKLMDTDIGIAKDALNSGDVVKMIRILGYLKNWQI